MGTNLTKSVDETHLTLGTTQQIPDVEKDRLQLEASQQHLNVQIDYLSEAVPNAAEEIMGLMRPEDIQKVKRIEQSFLENTLSYRAAEQEVAASLQTSLPALDRALNEKQIEREKLQTLAPDDLKAKARVDSELDSILEERNGIVQTLTQRLVATEQRLRSETETAVSELRAILNAQKPDDRNWFYAKWALLKVEHIATWGAEKAPASTPTLTELVFDSDKFEAWWVNRAEGLDPKDRTVWPPPGGTVGILPAVAESGEFAKIVAPIIAEIAVAALTAGSSLTIKALSKQLVSQASFLSGMTATAASTLLAKFAQTLPKEVIAELAKDEGDVNWARAFESAGIKSVEEATVGVLVGKITEKMFGDMKTTLQGAVQEAFKTPEARVRWRQVAFWLALQSIKKLEKQAKRSANDMIKEPKPGD